MENPSADDDGLDIPAFLRRLPGNVVPDAAPTPSTPATPVTAAVTAPEKPDLRAIQRDMKRTASYTRLAKMNDRKAAKAGKVWNTEKARWE